MIFAPLRNAQYWLIHLFFCFFSLIEKVSSGKHFSTARQTEKQDGSPHILHRYGVTVACQHGMMHRRHKGRTGTVSRWRSRRWIKMTGRVRKTRAGDEWEVGSKLHGLSGLGLFPQRWLVFLGLKRRQRRRAFKYDEQRRRCARSTTEFITVWSIKTTNASTYMANVKYGRCMMGNTMNCSSVKSSKKWFNFGNLVQIWKQEVLLSHYTQLC